jgi:hypothetical protein
MIQTCCVCMFYKVVEFSVNTINDLQYQSKVCTHPTHSRVFLYFYYFVHYRIIVKTSNYEITHMESCSYRKMFKQILQSSHPLHWWQLCTILAISQPASWGSHLECISINRYALLKVNLWNFFLMRLSQSVVLWQGRGGVQKIALFGKIPSPYYGKNTTN